MSRKITLITRTQKFTRITLYTVTRTNPAPTPLNTSVWGECDTSEQALKTIAAAGGVYPEGKFEKLGEGVTPVFAVIGKKYERLLVWNLMEIAKTATVTDPRGTGDTDETETVEA